MARHGGNIIKDDFVRALLCDGQVMASVASTKEIAQTARKYHNTSPEATAALGRLLTGGILMCRRLKDRTEKLTLIVKGGGTAGQLIVTASGDGAVKGYIENPGASAPIRKDGKLDVGGIVGKNGTLTVIRDTGKSEPYNGICNLVSGEIAEDIAQYYATSEQLPTAVMLGVLVDKDLSVKSSGGMLISPLPDCSEKALNELEEKIKAMPPISELLLKYECLEELLLDQFWDIGVQPLEHETIEYRCDCSRERFLRALLSLGKNELESLTEQTDPVEMSCQFCNRKYSFSKTELNKLLK